MRDQLVQAVCLVVCCAGCGGGLQLEDVSGTVNFSGQPVPYGQIEFFPKAQRADENPAGVAEIVNGQFDTSETGGKGILWGPHTVRVTAYEVRPAGDNQDETLTTDAAPPICLGYPVELDLQESPVTIDIPESARGFNMFSESTQQQSFNEP